MTPKKKSKAKPLSERPLTAQQRLFAEVYASGKSQVDAYREAYPKARLNDNAAYVSASKLLRNAKVFAYIEELQDAARSSAVATRQEVLEYLTAVIRTPIGEVSPASPLCQSHEVTEARDKITMPSKLAAAERLCKMEGWDSADKVELTGAAGSPLNPARDLTDAHVLAEIAKHAAEAQAKVLSRDEKES